MKNILLIAVICFIYIGCEKQNLMTDNKLTVADNNLTANSSLTNSNLRTSAHRTFYENPQGNNGFCFSPATNCLDDLIINGSPLTTMNGIINTINNGSSQAIASSFSTNRAFLLNYIDSEDVDGVINATESVSMRGTNPNNTRYMKFYSGSQLIAVYPIN